ncbi:MAG TPA: DUF86 domain-containing protein [Polyangiaceae bacterium]|jgi:uncharacterized protein YutE (UPF0331/DUF86 family)|nr:DUF86 domain-containing protein [Polyangiaceae bacterium]
MTDDAVPAKLAIVRENLEKLERIPQASWQEFDADFRNLDSALHRLQTTIQALIDIACYLVALRGLGVPRTSLDALEKLEAAALLPQGSAQRFAPIVGFRNRIVHLYDRIDPQIVYAILTQNRGDLVELARLLASTLKS